MALKFFCRCEGSTLDGTHDYSAGDTTWALSNASFTNTAPKVGTNSLAITANSGNAQLDISSQDLIAGAQGAVGFWFRVGTWQNGGSLFNASNSSAPNDNIRVYMTGTDELVFGYRQNGGSNFLVTTDGANIALDTWYFVVGRWHFANDIQSIEIYTADTGAAVYTNNVPNAPFDGTAVTSYDNLTIGNIGSNISQAYFDNIFIADTYDEAIEDYRVITSYTEYGVSGSVAGSVMGGKLLGRGVLTGGSLI